MIEETKEGLNIEIVDQEGRSMFPEGSKEPYERTRADHPEDRRAAEGDCPTGCRSPATPRPRRRRRRRDYGPWDLSADRANAVRQILEEQGLPSNNIYEVAGKADTDPLFPDDPYIAANRRVTIT